MTESESDRKIGAFIYQWADDPRQVREAFVRLKSYLAGKSGVTLEFISREGVTHSLRAMRSGQTRPLFALIDVIEDDPRWLSVCFYSDSIDDPRKLGNNVPGGILGEDGHCFDVETCDSAELTYLETRIDQAHAGRRTGSHIQP